MILTFRKEEEEDDSYMKVIFLDFDGVINNWYSSDKVDYDNVLGLLKIIESTGAKVVATTSNKASFQAYGIEYVKTNYFQYIKLLKEYGIEIFDVTPYMKQNREVEIMAYLESHPEIDQFLILDDNTICMSLLEHQVFLDLDMGIRDEHIEPSINILNGNLGFYPPNFDFNETLEQRSIRINEYHSRKR